MNDHDLTPDLEALLADAATGDLDPEDAERLRAAIDERPWLGDLVDEHRAIAARLASGPDAGLTDLERTRLHRAVLDAVTEPAPVATPSPRRPGSWSRWAFAAAAAVLVVVVASVGLLSGRLGGGGFDRVADEVASAPTDTDPTDTDAVEEGGSSEAAVPEADLGGDEAATAEAEAGDGAADSAMATPACPASSRTLDGVVGEVFDDPDEARSTAESVDPLAFAGEPAPIEAPDRITWVWRDADGSMTAILEVVAVADGWRVERVEACD